MYKLTLNSAEKNIINSIVARLSKNYKTVENADYINSINILVDEFPTRIKKELNDFRLKETHGGVIVVSGFDVGNNLIDTPKHWRNKPAASPSIESDLYFTLLSGLLGEIIGWSSQQDGYLLHDVIPIKNDEYEQLGSSSRVTLTLHSEDAFHDYRADYVGLMCMRNPDAVGTTYVKVDDIQLDESTKNKLFEKHYRIRPDESHKKVNNSENVNNLCKKELIRSFNKIEKMNSEAQKVPVLFGSKDDPYIRLDPYFMDDIIDDKKARAALNEIINQAEKNIKSVVLQPGEILFLDNYKVLHGRKSYQPKYNGKDRWLKRLNLTRNLRYSRDSRLGVSERVIY